MSLEALPIAQVGQAILKQPAQPVKMFDDGLNQFVEQLLTTMLKANGIGIAAPQVFDPRAIMIIASKANPRYPDAPDMQPIVMINPKLLSHNNITDKQYEGCLSVPGVRGLVPRYTEIEFEYQDLKGQIHRQSWQGFLARIFQHELDHLLGKTWLDRVESNQDIIAESVLVQQMANSHPKTSEN
ncbi:peptide deformylase [Saccharobesus litoralis]|uniref:Peptide deformylase n=1 Tax=Saccharobesus litoralis TaxID=2172099 RepID=A0A2S0VTS4_9ALTE|nr:peptide deformylase [Saccharobesus litoralis]AWB67490.1 peptide deformylase [Saccharobesus litoralis]